jgi:hypothetical protein
MVDEASVVARHVGLHALEEGGWARLRAVCGKVAGWSSSSGVVHTEEDVQGVDERALRRAGARELSRLSEIDRVSTLVLKDPRAVATVLSAEPGADLVVKYAWVASVADGVEGGGEGADHGGELGEGGGDATAGDSVIEKGLVEGLLHEGEGSDAGELDAGGGEEEMLLIGGASEEGYRANMAVDLAPVVEHGVCVCDDWGEEELAGDGEKGAR